MQNGHRYPVSLALLLSTLLPAIATAQAFPRVPSGAPVASWPANQPASAVKPVAPATPVPAAKTSDWDVTLGIGAMLRPTYEGSDSYTVSPIPLINATYADRISLGVNGISAQWRQEKLRFGGGIVYDRGRKDHDDGDGVFSQGDNSLRGMGDIDGALGVRGFASYPLGAFMVDGSITKLLGDDNDGLYVDAGVSRPYKITPKLTVTPNAKLTWADQNYMQTYFGVTSQQSLNSGFAQYDADAGLKNIDLGVRANYMLDSHWLVTSSATARFLTADAGDSPIAQSSVNGVWMTFIGYHF